MYDGSNIAALVGRLGAVRVGGAYRAACPCCQPGEGRPEKFKLAVNPGTDRPVVMKCWVCGAAGFQPALRHHGIDASWLGPRLPAADIEAAWRQFDAAVVAAPADAQLSGPEVRDACYSRLLADPACRLTPAHAEWLARRGLAPADAARLGYASAPAPADARRLAAALHDVYGPLLYGVPGFHEGEDGRPALACRAGILHPVRGRHGGVEAVKVRLLGDARRRYDLLSSHRHGGCKPPAHLVHWPLGSAAGPDGVLWATEGERKADVLRVRHGVAAVATLGAASRRPLYAALEEAGCETLVLAFDRDRAGRQAALEACDWHAERDHPRLLRLAEWDAAFAGADDALAAGRPVTVRTDFAAWYADLRGEAAGNPADAAAAVSAAAGVTNVAASPPTPPNGPQPPSAESRWGDDWRLGEPADQLMRAKLPPMRYAVDGLIPEGATLFVGRPKGGKSWLCLQMAAAVASGRPLWGRKTEPGVVLYLGLEDTRRRCQSRLDRQGVTHEMPGAENLRLVYGDDPRLRRPDRLEFLRYVLDRYEGGVSLLVVDTLQALRGLDGVAEGNAYHADYAWVRGVSDAAEQTQTPTVLVHHTRKNATGDSHLDDISGSLGLAGGVGNVLCFYRDCGSTYGLVKGGGRDVPEAERYLLWQDHTYTFEPLPGRPDDWREDVGDRKKAVTLDGHVYRALARAGPLMIRDLEDEVRKARPDVAEGSVGRCVSQLAREGAVCVEGSGDARCVFFASHDRPAADRKAG